MRITDQLNAQVAERRQAITAVEAELTKLRSALSATPANDAIKTSIDQVGSTITNALLSPRVYIHIADESQRRAARMLEQRLESSLLDKARIVVPGIQRVDGAPPQAILRCFVAEECRQYGPQLVDIVNRQLAEPRLHLQDFSRTYTPDGSIRPLHFEIYFASGTIRLVPGENRRGS